MAKMNKFEAECLNDVRLLKPLENSVIEKFDEIFDEMDCEAVDSILDEKCYNKSYNVQEYSKYRSMKTYFTIADECNGKQVIRTFCLWLRKNGINSFPKTMYKEVIQRWYNEKGKCAIIAANYRPLSQGLDDWNMKSNLSVKKFIPYTKMNYSTRHEYSQCGYGENMKINKIMNFIKRNGLKEKHLEDPGLPTIEAINYAMTPIGETLLKNNMYDLFKMVCRKDISEKSVEKNFNSIRIAIRHKYSIKDYKLYMDLLDMLNKLDKDTRNPHYICPVDLKAEHDKWVKKYNKKQEEEMLLNKMKEALQYEDQYQKEKSKFFNLMFSVKDDIYIRPIKTVAEMFEEGIRMHHCVGLYFKKTDSLIMVCRDSADRRIATIEINLKRCEVAQIRGLENTKPAMFDEIKECLKTNMCQIRDVIKNISKEEGMAA